MTVPYTLSVGLAVSTDGGLTFDRLFEGPIVDRTRLEPYSCLSPFVLVDEGTWKLWYASTTGFVAVDGRQEPQYQIRYADSADGIEWRRPLATCIGYSFDGEANGRPCVLKEDGRLPHVVLLPQHHRLPHGHVEELPDRLCRVGEWRGLDPARSPGGDWMLLTTDGTP